MGYPSFFPETALALLHALVYGMACMLAGASLIGLSVYSALLCSEIFFSQPRSDRKSTRLNSSHVEISYAVFCLKKKKKNFTYFIQPFNIDSTLSIYLLSVLNIILTYFFCFRSDLHHIACYLIAGILIVKILAYI